MADYSLSVEAGRDLFEIASYRLQTWGEQQAGLYLRRLHKLLERLAENPRLGTGCDDIRSGYFRRLHGSHMIFNKRSPEGIAVIRVLHTRMDYLQQL